MATGHPQTLIINTRGVTRGRSIKHPSPRRNRVVIYTSLIIFLCRLISKYYKFWKQCVLLPSYTYIYIQGDQLNMDVFFWYLEKSDLTSVGYCTRVHCISRFLQGNRKNTAMLNWSPNIYAYVATQYGPSPTHFKNLRVYNIEKVLLCPPPWINVKLRFPSTQLAVLMALFIMFIYLEWIIHYT